MTFTLLRASDFNFSQVITDDSLEDLKNIYPNLIVNFADMEITIYDDYVE